MVRGRGRVVAALIAGVVLAGCTSAPASSVTDTSTDVAFRGCGEIACSGSLAGAPYQILLPTHWNGTLLIYSHGYRTAQPAPPDFAPVSTAPEPAPGWSDGQRSVGQALLAQGYALAGSASASNGWAVTQGITAAEDLHAFFRDNVGAPNRVYAWGDSLGGLVTAELAERHPDWVSGSAPMCAPLAGLNPNMDLALDAAYAVKTLLWPKLKLVGYTSYQDAVVNFEGAAKQVVAAASDLTGGGTAKVAFIAALVDAPTKTQMFDGSSTSSQVKVAAEGILTALGFGTFGRYDIETRAGGNPSQNTTTEYSERFTVADQARIDALSAGATARFVKALVAGRRVAADPAARATALTLGNPRGLLATPMLTLHTAYDPLVLVQNQSWYAARVAALEPSRTADLRQLITVPPDSYQDKPGAPYGAGHCNFTAPSRIGLITVLDDWVRKGEYPGTVSVDKALGPDSGYQPEAVAGPWPLGGDTPTG